MGDLGWVLTLAVSAWLMPFCCLWWAPKAESQRKRFVKLEDFVRENTPLLVQRHRDRPCKEASPGALDLLLNTLRPNPLIRKPSINS